MEEVIKPRRPNVSNPSSRLITKVVLSLDYLDNAVGRLRVEFRLEAHGKLDHMLQFICACVFGTCVRRQQPTRECESAQGSTQAAIIVLYGM